MQKQVLLNKIQYAIVRSLFLKDAQRFSELNQDSIANDHFSYHIRTLIGNGYIYKDSEGKYHLTTTGRTSATLLKNDESSYVNQGFVACRVVLTRERNGEKQYLLQRRTAVPYMGSYAEPGGKIIWGEPVLQSAHRNMLEQTGLDCDLEIKGQVHIIDDFENEVVQDKYFYVIKATNPKGTLKEFGSTGVNVWMSEKEVKSNPKVLHAVQLIGEIADSPTYRFEETIYYPDEY